jgi:hypothetical protein
MGGGVNPFEWILPPVALSHMIVDEASKIGGGDGVAAPGSPDAKRAAVQDEAGKQQEDQRQLLSQQAKKEEQRLADAQPENVRRRAYSAAKALGESGKRPSASAYLSSV